MSVKAKIFDAALGGFGPARTHEFLVVIPDLVNTGIVVESLTFPTPQFGEVSLSYWGETMYFPSTEVASGEWKIVVPESPTMRQKWEVLRKMARMSPIDANYFDVDVVPLFGGVPLAAIKLLNCWVRGRDSVSLSGTQASEPWKWNLSIMYNGIEESVNFDNIPFVQDAIIAASLSVKL